MKSAIENTEFTCKCIERVIFIDQDCSSIHITLQMLTKHSLYLRNNIVHQKGNNRIKNHSKLL